MGGGKDGGQQVYVPPDYNTTTAVGDKLAPETQKFEGSLLADDRAAEENIDRKRMGTRGLRIPKAKGG